VLDHKQSLPTSLYIVLSQLELGHSLQLAGDLDAAARTFENLAHLWKDADPDFPPLKRLHHYQRNIVTRN
jgi:eukaryotic-like serine/threonine-protein kinase